MDLQPERAKQNPPMPPETKTQPTPAPAVPSTGSSPEFYRPQRGTVSHPTGPPAD